MVHFLVSGALHSRQWHRAGICRQTGGGSIECAWERALWALSEAVGGGGVPSDRLGSGADVLRPRGLGWEYLAELCDLPIGHREDVFTQAQEACTVEIKKLGQEYAREQVELLARHGMVGQAASRVMQAAGPAMAFSALCWGRYAQQTVGRDAARLAIAGPFPFGWGRTEQALRRLGLEPPEVWSSGEFFRVLAGAKVALEQGLPEEFLKER